MQNCDLAATDAIALASHFWQRLPGGFSTGPPQTSQIDSLIVTLLGKKNPPALMVGGGCGHRSRRVRRYSKQKLETRNKNRRSTILGTLIRGLLCRWCLCQWCLCQWCLCQWSRSGRRRFRRRSRLLTSLVGILAAGAQHWRFLTSPTGRHVECGGLPPLFKTPGWLAGAEKATGQPAGSRRFWRKAYWKAVASYRTPKAAPEDSPEIWGAEIGRKTAISMVPAEDRKNLCGPT